MSGILFEDILWQSLDTMCQRWILTLVVSIFFPKNIRVRQLGLWSHWDGTSQTVWPLNIYIIYIYNQDKTTWLITSDWSQRVIQNDLTSRNGGASSCGFRVHCAVAYPMISILVNPRRWTEKKKSERMWRFNTFSSFVGPCHNIHQTNSMVNQPQSSDESAPRPMPQSTGWMLFVCCNT